MPKPRSLDWQSLNDLERRRVVESAIGVALGYDAKAEHKMRERASRDSFREHCRNTLMDEGLLELLRDCVRSPSQPCYKTALKLLTRIANDVAPPVTTVPIPDGFYAALFADEPVDWARLFPGHIKPGDIVEADL